MSRTRTWFFVFLFWALLTVVYSTQVALIPRPPAEPGLPWLALAWQAVYYLAWAPMTLAIWRVSRGWDIDRIGTGSFLLRHAVLASIVCVAHGTAVAFISRAVVGSPGSNESFVHLVWTYLRVRVHTQVLIYAAIVGAGQALGFYSQYRERQLAAARLEAQLAEARLDTLRTQLQPHFLFNSLHSIASLARAGDNAGVVRLISGFSDLLRHLLDTRTTHHAVREELALVERYLDLQRVRFGDRLRVRIQTAPGVETARIPLLIVQPLVENALRHGLAPRIEGGSLAVHVRRVGGALIIEVTDDGIGLPSGWTDTASPGTGLRNLRSRLDAEFGARASLTLHAAPGGGVLAVVRLPYITA